MEPNGCFRAIIFVVVCCIYSIRAASVDPCINYNQLPRAIYRGGKCKYVYEKEVCDSRLPFQWYKAVGLNGTVLEIQTTPAPFETCGTKFPYWMNGTHPTVAEKEVSRTVCMTDNTSCDKTETIQVKNCTGFYVYRLRGTSSCSSGYCFGKDEPCPPFDPCDIYEYSEIRYDRGRSSVCDFQSGLCENVNGSLWYSFEGAPQSLNLSSTCPNGLNGCGASQSIWVNDTKVLSNGTEQLTVCTKRMGDCCKASHTILSKQCKSFRVYNFGGLPATSCRRFCTDDAKVTCPLSPLSSSPGTTALNSNINGTTEENASNASQLSFGILLVAQLIHLFWY